MIPTFPVLLEPTPTTLMSPASSSLVASSKPPSVMTTMFCRFLALASSWSARSRRASSTASLTRVGPSVGAILSSSSRRVRWWPVIPHRTVGCVPAAMMAISSRNRRPSIKASASSFARTRRVEPPAASAAFMLAELSTTSTSLRASRISHLKIGSDSANTTSSKKAIWTRSESRWRSFCQIDRGCFSSKICRQNRVVETGTRLIRIFRM